MRLSRRAAVLFISCIIAMTGIAQKADPSSQSALALADQIAAILGPGEAHLTIRNLSGISADALPLLRKSLEQQLKSRGISLTSDDNANTIRVTLSESATERLWIAEIVEGNTTQVAIVDDGPTSRQQASPTNNITLRLQTILTSRHPVLALLETSNGWIVLEPEQLVLYRRTANGMQAQVHFDIGQIRSLPRDPRGILRADTSQTQFSAWLAGAQCTGATSVDPLSGDWSVNCHSSDDPWPIFQGRNISAFYNSARNYFTGVTAPSLGADLPAFYTAMALPRAGGTTAWMVAGLDGRVSLLENNSLKAITGTRDWGSDFAILQSGCGSGAQIVTSSSGSSNDSLRAYEFPALDARPASPALELSGAVTALSSAPDGKSLLAVIQRSPNEYEVDRVSALCN